MPYAALWAAGVFSPTIKELRHTYYQWSRAFTIDSSVTERELASRPPRSTRRSPPSTYPTNAGNPRNWPPSRQQAAPGNL